MAHARGRRVLVRNDLFISDELVGQLGGVGEGGMEGVR